MLLKMEHVIIFLLLPLLTHRFREISDWLFKHVPLQILNGLPIRLVHCRELPDEELHFAHQLIRLLGGLIK